MIKLSPVKLKPEASVEATGDVMQIAFAINKEINFSTEHYWPHRRGIGRLVLGLPVTLNSKYCECEENLKHKLIHNLNP